MAELKCMRCTHQATFTTAKTAVASAAAAAAAATAKAARGVARRWRRGGRARLRHRGSQGAHAKVRGAAARGGRARGEAGEGIGEERGRTPGNRAGHASGAVARVEVQVPRQMRRRPSESCAQRTLQGRQGATPQNQQRRGNLLGLLPRTGCRLCLLCKLRPLCGRLQTPSLHRGLLAQGLRGVALHLELPPESHRLQLPPQALFLVSDAALKLGDLLPHLLRGPGGRLPQRRLLLLRLDPRVAQQLKLRLRCTVCAACARQLALEHRGTLGGALVGGDFDLEARQLRELGAVLREFILQTADPGFKSLRVQLALLGLHRVNSCLAPLFLLHPLGEVLTVPRQLQVACPALLLEFGHRALELPAMAHMPPLAGQLERACLTLGVLDHLLGVGRIGLASLTHSGEFRLMSDAVPVLGILQRSQLPSELERVALELRLAGGQLPLQVDGLPLPQLRLLPHANNCPLSGALSGRWHLGRRSRQRDTRRARATQRRRQRPAEVVQGSAGARARRRRRPRRWQRKGRRCGGDRRRPILPRDRRAGAGHRLPRNGVGVAPRGAQGHAAAALQAPGVAQCDAQATALGVAQRWRRQRRRRRGRGCRGKNRRTVGLPHPHVPRGSRRRRVAAC
mmetsp:Transcript_15443/g.49593  ORF Transcript_15443/g.49593 Transcript_15443/m.49593 type:complete len:625 (-) Transcript_15443:299-2173(-)